MDHRYYEEWLLNDERLTPEQDRDLRIHLRGCASCAMLARSNLALRAAPVAAPAEGFALRFQARLAAERKVQRRRTVIGSMLLTLTGAGLLFWILSPYIPYFTLAPSQMFTLWLSNVIYIALTVRTVGILGVTLLNIVGSFVPAYVWIISLALFGGFGFLLNVSFRRVGKFVESAA
jgi:hypothetical protein